MYRSCKCRPWCRHRHMQRTIPGRLRLGPRHGRRASARPRRTRSTTQWTAPHRKHLQTPQSFEAVLRRADSAHDVGKAQVNVPLLRRTPPPHHDTLLASTPRPLNCPLSDCLNTAPLRVRRRTEARDRATPPCRDICGTECRPRMHRATTSPPIRPT